MTVDFIFEKQPRLPVQPLIDAAPGRTIHEKEIALGCGQGAVHRWLREGGITDWCADKYAIALGRHPSEFWPEEF